VNEPEAVANSLQFSKRAARRLIQRAFVLAGRDRHLREHIREAHLTTLWTIEDWGFAWTIRLDRGKIEFDRRPAKKPDVTLTWRTAHEFFEQAAKEHWGAEGFEYIGPQESMRTLERLYHCFSLLLAGVLKNPVDENGDPLV
jgi:hypothetical protein